MPRRQEELYRGEDLATAVTNGAGVEQLPALPDGALPAGPISEADEDEAQARWRRDRTPYQNAFTVRALAFLDAAAARVQAALATVKGSLGGLVKQLRAAATDLEAVDRQYGNAVLVREQAEGRLRREYERIKGFPTVSRVRITTEELVVETTNLVIVATDGSRWDVGPWEIHIPRGHRVESITCLSLRRPVRHDQAGWIHPHVNRDGGICWGNLGPTLRAAMKEAQYDVVVELVIAMLNSGRQDYNPGRGTWDGHDYGQRLAQVADRVR